MPGFVVRSAVLSLAVFLLSLSPAFAGSKDTRESTAPADDPCNEPEYDDGVCHANYMTSEPNPVVLVGDSEWACPPTWLSGTHERPDGAFYGCRVDQAEFCDRDADGHVDAAQAGTVVRVCNLDSQCHVDWTTGDVMGGDLQICGGCAPHTLVIGWPADSTQPDPSAPNPPVGECIQWYPDGTCADDFDPPAETSGPVDSPEPMDNPDKEEPLPVEDPNEPAPIDDPIDEEDKDQSQPVEDPYEPPPALANYEGPLVLMAGTPGAPSHELQLVQDLLQSRGLPWEAMAVVDLHVGITPDEARTKIADAAGPLVNQAPDARVVLIGSSLGAFALLDAMVHYGAQDRVSRYVSIGGFPAGWNGEKDMPGFTAWGDDWAQVEVDRFLLRAEGEIGGVDKLLVTGQGELAAPAEADYGAFQGTTSTTSGQGFNARDLVNDWFTAQLVAEWILPVGI